jgi:hypothetical protein
VFDLGATGEMGEEGAAVLLTHLEAMARHLQELSFDTNELTDAGLSDLGSSVYSQMYLAQTQFGRKRIEAAVCVLLDNLFQRCRNWNSRTIWTFPATGGSCRPYILWC